MSINKKEEMALEASIMIAAIEGENKPDVITVACLQIALRTMLMIGMDDEEISGICEKALLKTKKEFEQLKKEGSL